MTLAFGASGPARPSPPDQGALSGVQLPIWLGEQAEPGTTRYLLATVLDVEVAPDAARFVEAARRLVDRHDALRTSFEFLEGEPVRRVHDRVDVQITITDASALSDDEIDDIIADETSRPFDLRRPGLCRFRVLHLGGHRAVLIVVAHHLAADAWGMAVLADELAAGYSIDRTEDGPPATSYARFVEAEHSMLTGERGELAGRHWSGVVSGLRPLEIPVDRDPDGDGRGRSVAVALPHGLETALRSFALRHDVAPRAILLAAYQLVLGRLAGERRSHCVEYMANRRAPDFGVVGTFANPVLRTVELRDDATAASLVQTVHDELTTSRRHDWYPLGDQLQAVRRTPTDRLLDHAFAWHKVRRSPSVGLAASIAAGRTGERSDVAGIGVTTRTVPQTPVVGSLTLLGVAGRGTLDLVVQYRSDRWSRSGADRLGRRIVSVLEQFVANPSAPIDAIDVVLDDERRDRTSAWEAADRSTSNGDVLTRILRAAAVRASERAVTCHDVSVCYAELVDSIERRAAVLVDRGVGRGDRVGLHIDRSAGSIAWMLAAWRVGAAYVPISTELPTARVAPMTELAGIGAVVTGYPAEWETVGSPQATAIGADDLRSETSLPPYVGPDPADIAYVMFTSGSTGVPKGVEVRHEGVTNLADAIVEQTELTSHDVVLAITTASFDISIVELLVPLTVGAAIELLDRDERLDLGHVARALERVTVAQATPTMWQLLVSNGWSGSSPLRLISGGEPLGRPLAEQLLVRCDELWNMYGPTETTVWSTCARVRSGTGAVPIGTALRGNRLYVLDDQRRPRPDGAVGELWIGGRGVAAGYAGRADLTAESFVPDPHRPGSTMYRTGDLVHRRCSDGQLVFHRRIDDQVKVRGHRIELGDVESALATIEGVATVAATVEDVDGGDRRLVGFVTFRDSSRELDTTAARTHLGQLLPDYMVPSHVVRLDRIPTTPNGKTDRSRLPLQHRRSDARPDPDEAVEVANTELGRTITRIWEDVLQSPGARPQDEFFELGGDSMLAVRMFARIERDTGRRLPLSTLLRSPRLGSLIEAFERPTSSDRRSLVGVRESGQGRPFFYVSPFLVTVLSMRPIAEHLPDEQPMFVLQPLGMESDDEAHDTVERMAAQYLDEIRTVQPAGPYAIGGHCAGSYVAFEMARQLQRAGEQVDVLILVDSEPPNFSAPRQPLAGRVRDLMRYASDGRVFAAVRWKLHVFVEHHLERRFGSGQQQRVAQLRATHAEAHSRYVTTPIEGDAVLVRSGEFASLRQLDWHLRWAELISGTLRVEVAPCTHAALVEPDGARFIAGVIARAVNPPAHRPGRP